MGGLSTGREIAPNASNRIARAVICDPGCGVGAIRTRSTIEVFDHHASPSNGSRMKADGPPTWWSPAYRMIGEAGQPSIGAGGTQPSDTLNTVAVPARGSTAQAIRPTGRGYIGRPSVVCQPTHSAVPSVTSA